MAGIIVLVIEAVSAHSVALAREPASWRWRRGYGAARFRYYDLRF